MKRMALILIAAGALACTLACQCAAAQAAAPAPASAAASSPVAVAPVVTAVTLDDPLSPSATAAVVAELHAHGAVVSVRRYAGQDDAPEAMHRIAQAFAALLKARGIHAWPVGSAPEAGSDHPASVEIDPSFYVYTQKFNAQRVRLPVYVAAQLHDTPDAHDIDAKSATAPVAASEPSADVLRVAAGALGIVTGLLSPSRGAYMIATGSRASNTLNERTAALFGAGPAPTRLLGSHLERYRRGEQEATMGVRVRSGSVDERFVVTATAAGDDPPFAIDPLSTAAWQGAVDQLSGQAGPHRLSLETMLVLAAIHGAAGRTADTLVRRRWPGGTRDKSTLPSPRSDVHCIDTARRPRRPD